METVVTNNPRYPHSVDRLNTINDSLKKILKNGDVGVIMETNDDIG